MLALSIAEQDIKGFMDKLLRDGAFDGFETRSVEVVSLTRFEISGIAMDKPETGNEPQSRFCKWEALKPFVFQMVKGSRKPKLVKVSFAADEHTVSALHPNAQALFINITYENNIIQCTTGTAQKNFDMDKSLPEAWDAYVRNFFAAQGIPVVENEFR